MQSLWNKLKKGLILKGKLTSIWFHLHRLNYKSLLIIILLLLSSLVLLSKLNQTPKKIQAGWFNDSWLYRKAISIGNTGAADSNKKVKIDLDTATLITAGKLQSNCADIRFTDLNGKILPHYLDSTNGACNTASTDYYVLLETIHSGTTTIYNYYGNPSAQNTGQPSQFSQDTFSPTSGPTLNTEESSPGPIAHWKFDEGYGTTTSDSTLQENTISLGTGDSAPQWQTEDMCINGKCLYFGGDGDRAQTSSVFSYESDALTVSAWVKSNTTVPDTYSRLISQWSPGFIMAINSSGNLRVYLWDDAEDSLNGTANINDGLWHHLSFTIDTSSGQAFLYVDGKQDGSKSTTITSDLIVNRVLDLAGDREFKGFLDEVKVYPYARSADQIKADYTSAGSIKGVSAVLGTSQDNLSALNDGLIGYWKMDEASWNGTADEVIDSSGNANHGIGIGATPPTTTAGKFGNGGEFDGSEDYVSVSGISSESFYTVSAWVKTTDTDSSYHSILRNPYNVVSTNYALFVRNGKVQTYDGIGGSPRQVVSDTTVADGNWHFVTSTYNGSELSIYVDGMRENSGNYTGSIGSAGTIWMGNDNWSNYFEGQIDEVRIYNRALSAKEVRDLYHWAPGPVIHYKMDENTGTSTTYDSSANNNNGTLNNIEESDWVLGKYGSALNFNATAEKITINSPVGSTGYTTASVWHKRDDSSASTSWRTLLGDTSANIHHLILNSTTRNIGIFDGSWRGFGYNVPNDNKWHHYAVIYNSASTATLYVDGVYKNQIAIVLNLSTYPIGSIGNWASNNYWAGPIDDVRIYNYARTPGQIVEDMNAGHPLPGSPIGSQTLYYKLDEGYGTTAHDSSGQGNDGTLYCTGTDCQIPTWQNEGKLGKALYFTGSGTTWRSYIRRSPLNLSTTTGSKLTFSTWVNPDTAQASGGGWLVRNGHGADENYGINLGANSGGNYRLSFTWYDGTTFRTLTTSGYHVPQSVWSQVTTVISQGEWVKFYVNGTLKEQLTWTNDNSVAATSYLNIGGHGGTTNQYLIGYMDEVKIFTDELTSDQIKLDYNQGKALVLGSVSTESDGSTPSFSSDRSYCLPGDTSTCDSPIGEWNFEEKTGGIVNDTSGTGHTGTWYGTGDHWSTGKFGTAGQFNAGSYDDRLEITGITEINNNDFTINGWIYVREQPDFYSSMLASSNSGFVLYFNQGGDGAMDAYAQLHNGSGWTPVSCNTNSNFNKWYMLTLVYRESNTLAQVYLDGQKCSNDVTITGGLNDAYSTTINQGYYAGSEHNGFIDQVRIYDYARTPAQIALDYNRGAPIAHWKFDQGEGGNVYDSSGKANHGTLGIGDSAPAWTDTGKYNSALNFDGDGDYVLLQGSILDNLATNNDFTISTWNKQTAFSGIEVIIAQAYGGHSFGRWLVGTNGSKAFVSLYGGASSPSYKQVTGNTTLATDTWNHTTAVFSRTDGKITLYVNGVYDNEVAWDGYIEIMQSNKVNLGRNARSTPVFHMSGLIDNVQAYNYALTETQIKNLYNQNSALRFGPSEGSP